MGRQDHSEEAGRSVLERLGHLSVIGIVERFFFFSSRRRHTRFDCDWSSDVCSSDLIEPATAMLAASSNWKFGSDRFMAPLSWIHDVDGCSAQKILAMRGWPETHQKESRSEERRVGKECRSRWSPYH